MTLVRPVDVALTYEGVREVGGPNRGPEVERFLRTVRKPPGLAWCAAFVCTCVVEAYQQNWHAAGNVGPIDEKSLPIPMTAGVFVLWSMSPRRLRCAPKPGAIFIIDNGMNRAGQRIGHTGFVVEVQGRRVKTVEGNTSPAGSRDGDGVYVRSRLIADLTGFLDVNPAEPAALV